MTHVIHVNLTSCTENYAGCNAVNCTIHIEWPQLAKGRHTHVQSYQQALAALEGTKVYCQEVPDKGNRSVSTWEPQ